MASGALVNHLTICVLLGFITYVVLDVNNSVSYEKSNTNKYFTKIGLAAYVNPALNAINSNPIYRENILPAYRQSIKAARYYTENIRKNVSINLYKATKLIKKYTLDFVDFLDEFVFPKLIEWKNSAVKAYQKHIIPIYGIVQDKILSFVASREKNDIYSKIHDTVINFFLASRKQALSAVEWLTKNVQQIMS